MGPDLPTITEWACREAEAFLAGAPGSVTPDQTWDSVFDSLDETDLFLRAEGRFGVCLTVGRREGGPSDPVIREIVGRRPFRIRDFADLIHRSVEVGTRPPCQTCGYELTGIESDRCPECGAARTGEQSRKVG